MIINNCLFSNKKWVSKKNVPSLITSLNDSIQRQSYKNVIKGEEQRQTCSKEWKKIINK